MKKLPPGDRTVFIKLGAWWGMMIGLIVGGAAALPTLTTNPLMIFLYALLGALAGGILGGLQGLALASFTGTALNHPGSILYTEAGMVANYRTALATASAGTVFIVPFAFAFQGIWQVDLGRGIAISGMVALAAGFIGYKIGDWYIAQHYGMNRKSHLDEQAGGEAHLTLDEILERHNQLHHPIRPDEDRHDQQYRNR